MTVKDQAPTMEETVTPTDGASGRHTVLQAEANRLVEFKKDRVKRNNQTPCPACATYVHINANKCPHCTSDIAANNALVRESLRQLEEITAELESMHEQHMERLHGAPRRPFSERFKSFFSDAQTREDMKIVVPALFLFFVAVATFRILGNQTLFWSVAVAGGVIAYSLLNKFNVKRIVTIDLYRSVLVFGLLALMASAVAQPGSFWTGPGKSTVEVRRSTINIRSSNTTQSSVIATAHQGDKLKVLERKDDWYRIKTSDGQTGWVYAPLVRN
jgi:hypothetical protein